MRRTWNELGGSSALLYWLHRAMSLVTGDRIKIEKFLLVAQPVTPRAGLPPGRGADIEVREVLAGTPIEKCFPRTSSTIALRFRQGTHCLVATRGDTFVGYHWLASGPCREGTLRTEFRTHPPQTTAWNFDLYVAPEYRRGLAFMRLWDASHDWLRRQGMHWVFSRISAYNVSSLRAHLRMGAVTLGWLIYFRIGPCQVSVCSMAPHLHVSFSERSMPVIVVHAPSSGTTVS